MNEAELARAIASGAAESPTRIGGGMLVACRISGTGLAARATERVYRDPKIWLAPETLSRVLGCAVVLDHPAGPLDGEEFAMRSLGAVIHSYVGDRDGFESPDGPDLWGIARLFVGPETMAELARGSTSPCVTFNAGSQNETITLPDGSRCLCEAPPDDIEHLALVSTDADGGGGAGVWDKNDPQQRGIRIDTKEQVTMDEDEKEAPADKKADAADEPPAWAKSFADSMAGLARRMDAMEAARADAVKKDSEEKGKEKEEEAVDPAEERRRDATLSEVQCRADQVYQAWGKRAAPPLSSETVLAYRRRMLHGHKDYSPDWKDHDIFRMDAAVLDIAEKQIYADSEKASAHPKGPDDGRMISRKRVTDSGHTVTEWHGQKTVFELFSSPPMYATAFMTPQHRGQ